MDSTQVNWNELAQDALECGRQAVGEITTLIKGVAPEVWEMCVRQAYANVLGNMLIVVGLLLLVALIRSFIDRDWIIGEEYHYKKECSYYDEHNGMVEIDGVRVYKIRNKDYTAKSVVVGLVFRIVLGLLSIPLILVTSDLVKVFINPNYYAIQEFFKMIGAN